MGARRNGGATEWGRDGMGARRNGGATEWAPSRPVMAPPLDKGNGSVWVDAASASAGQVKDNHHASLSNPHVRRTSS
ncbi:MAG: hypothetical protein EA405_09040 [Rhodospirillales bacterium]|nr:MAG: hypothetical protein EA405_09040 [Rhodospirillales bacterium]